MLGGLCTRCCAWAAVAIVSNTALNRTAFMAFPPSVLRARFERARQIAFN
jgi:hypothetical protein